MIVIRGFQPIAKQRAWSVWAGIFCLLALAFLPTACAAPAPPIIAGSVPAAPVSAPISAPDASAMGNASEQAEVVAISTALSRPASPLRTEETPAAVVQVMLPMVLHQPETQAALSGTVSITVSLPLTFAANNEAGQSPLALPTPTLQAPVAAAPVLPEPTPAPTPDGAVRTVRVPVFMYHYLSVPPADANAYRQDLSVPPDLFAAQLDALQAAGYTTISLYDLHAYLTQGAPLPDNPVVITFDDGYRDNYENALPALTQRGMTATFFVVTDFLDEGRPEYLTWDMARAMQDAGMNIESHGRNHVSLKDKDTDYLVWQALGSKETLAYELGVAPRFVSYPAGEFDALTKEIFQSAGYWAGFTTVQGATHSSADDPFEMRRVRVRGTTTPEEIVRLAGLDW